MRAVVEEMRAALSTLDGQLSDLLGEAAVGYHRTDAFGGAAIDSVDLLGLSWQGDAADAQRAAQNH